MTKVPNNLDYISDEALAAWLDGNATPDEVIAIDQELNDPNSIVAEIIDIARDTELYTSVINDEPVEIIGWDIPVVEPDDDNSNIIYDGDNTIDFNTLDPATIQPDLSEDISDMDSDISIDI